jgi:hypothetical protein
MLLGKQPRLVDVRPELRRRDDLHGELLPVGDRTKKAPVTNKTSRSGTLALTIAVVGALAACGATTSGGGSGGANTVSGTVGSASYSVGSALGIVTSADSSGSCVIDSDGGTTCTTTSQGQAIVIILTNRAGVTCASQASSNTSFASVDVLQLAAINENGNVATGTYEIETSSTSAPSADALFSTTTSTCAAGLNLSPTSGTVTLSHLSATAASGTYDVTFGAEGTFSGSFDVALCAQSTTGVTPPDADAGAPVCVPP